jgi:predicted lipoprotein with Yx(FWY)xxD motif
MSADGMLRSPGARVARVAIPVAVIALAAAACGSSSGAKTTPAAAATNAPAATSSPASATGSSVTIDTKSGSLGTYLTDASGRTLYEFGSDTSAMSTCNGACATAWPPLTSNSAATAGSGVTASDIGSITRADGSKQVTYHGHPLYYFSLDKAAGDTKGQGAAAFGAKWWVLSPAGNKITTAAGSAPSSAPAGGSMGYSY